MDTIRLKGLRLEAFLGATDQERARPQPVELDIELWLDLRQAGRSDDLDDTLDYARVVEAAQQVVQGQRFHLLEAVAERVAEAALRLGAREVLVRARKFDPPVKAPLPVAEVEVLRESRPDFN